MSKENIGSEANMPRISFRCPESMISEIDAAWFSTRHIRTRSDGIRWLIRKGLDSVKNKK